MRCALAVIVCLLALAPIAAQAPQQPTFRTGVDLVTVDVHVVDGAGRPVAGLGPEDFSITVDGKPRPIVAADYMAYTVSTAAPSTPAPRPSFSANWIDKPAAPTRTIVIAVDHENIASGFGRAAIDAIGRFLDRMAPDDRVGLMLLTRGNLAIDPTTNREAIKKVLPTIIGRQGRADAANPYALGQVEAFAFEHDKKAWGAVVARECLEKFSGARLQACISEMETSARQVVADSRRRQVDSMRSLVALFDALAKVPGPKTVVLVSQQLPVAPFPAEVADFNAEARPLAAAAARASVSVYVLHLDLPTNSVELRMVPTSERDDAYMASYGLETVTTVTGGRRLMISGQPEGAYDRIAVEISGYYLLGFRSEPADRDGKPHGIKVEVRRKGVDIRARQMFSYAAEPAVADATAADTVNRVLRAATSETGIPIAVATYSLVDPAGGAAQMRVLITAEIDRRAAKEASLTVGYTLAGSGGKNAGANVEQVTLRPAIGHPDSPLVYTAAALVPPGAYTLRLAAADAALRTGSVVHHFEARPVEASGVRIGDLVVMDPYVAEAGRPRPSVSGTASGDLTCYFEANAGTPPPSGLTARLELADGVDGPARTAEAFEATPAEPGGRIRLTGVLSLAGIPPGDYVARAVVLVNGSPLGRAVRPVRVVRSAEPAAAAAPAVDTPPTARAARPTTAAADVGELMPRVADYIKDYAEQMALVIGIEHYGQWLQREDFNPGAGVSRAISRQMVSEFALIRNKDDWDGFRNVYEVDGKPVPDAKDRLATLFAQAPATAVEQTRKIAAESSRYNLGAMQRNFNVPTVVLYFLSAANQARFRFTKDKDDDVGGVKVWKVKYEETRRPTLIRTSAGKDMPLKGEAWIDPISGRVLKTHMQLDSEMRVSTTTRTDLGEKVKTTASITVTYAPDAKLQILVPAEMLETYEAPMRSAFTGDDNMTKVNCRATYSDFKRFETSGRLIVK